MYIEASYIEKPIWKIKLLSRNQKIHHYANNLFDASKKLIESLSTNSDDEKREPIIQESESIREALIAKMNRDIHKF